MIQIYDIETRPRPDKVKEFTKPFSKTFYPTEFDASTVKTGNISDPIKVKAKIEASRLAHEGTNQAGFLKIEQEKAEYDAKALDRAALHPATSEICAIGVHIQNAKQVRIITGKEKDILEEFWRLVSVEEGIWASYSGSNDKSNFDIRHIIHRSWVNRVTILWGTIKNGFIDRSFMDLAQTFLAGAPYPSYCSADDCAKQLGIIGTNNDAGTVYSKDQLEDTLGITGKNFHEFLDGKHDCKLTAKEQRNVAIQYLKNDIILERGIADIIL